MVDRLGPIMSYLRKQTDTPRRPTPCGGHDTELPFFTVSRQAGAGGEPLAHRLAERLNLFDLSDRPWSTFDRELVERVASDHNLSAELIDTIGMGGRNWLEDMFETMTTRPLMRPGELELYRSVAETVMALAEAGRVVLVGQGAAFITQQRTGGIHVRLVAPLSHRIETTAWARQLTRREALEYIRRTERRREAFFRRFWPDQSLTAESFTVTFNTAHSTTDQQVDALIAMLPQYAPQRILDTVELHESR
ncbi:cytidylate kinase-like family protein [Algisphaera agarilytica]|uniref:Cytidylate kinase n=1 Tax=Algisphaera agarilytica TaxID=1385975 RepID=A0A7X0H624_9BACT|nr:cytidylate kinase family protein [Algisphaera agarilytica]MBB6429968.1 hypothetical protein [Algisphaera agarilytica]